MPPRKKTARPPDVSLDDVLADLDLEDREVAQRAASSVEIDDEQLVEVAELGDRPRATVAFHDLASEHVTQARRTIEALGHGLVSGAVGKAAVGAILKSLRGDRPPEVVVVALPGGESILDAARALAPRRPVLVVIASGPAQEAADRAHQAGADLVTLRPHDAEHLGPVLMAAAALSAERSRLLTLQGTEALLRARLAGANVAATATGFQTVETFRRILELELKRARRFGYALSVCQLALVATDAPPAVTHQLRLRAAAAIATAIRDIDFPVEIADDRFLVLLPYTDATGAAAVGRRVIAAVRAAEPVRHAGRTFSPSVIAGVAGVPGGSELSVAQLMRAAGDALKQARLRTVPLVVAS
jgi:GGDEF domain-containing protein